MKSDIQGQLNYIRTSPSINTLIIAQIDLKLSYHIEKGTLGDSIYHKFHLA